ncbi:MAG: hypothetical protein CM15mP36_11430 [Flavobacteriales bacterium]|nr:MAG: hypothetical protein CM15mP36_11430 [Flavobacteriales bacterium]
MMKIYLELKVNILKISLGYKRSSSGSIDNIANYLIKHEDLKIEEMTDK